MKKIQISENVQVYTHQYPNGYGYALSQKTFIEMKPNGFERNDYKMLFHTYDKELLKSEFEKIEKTKIIPENWPDTSKEVPPMRIFKYRSKHYDYHFDAQTPEKLEKAARKVLKDESPYWPPTAPKNESGIEAIEELEKIGIESLQKEVEEKFKKFQKEMKTYNSNLTGWNNLQLVLEGKGNLRNVLDVLGEYEPDRWEIIDFDSVE